MRNAFFAIMAAAMVWAPNAALAGKIVGNG